MKDIGRCVQDYNLVSSGENALRFVKINCKAMAKPSLSLRNSVATGHRADLNCLCFLTVETRSVECGVPSALRGTVLSGQYLCPVRHTHTEKVSHFNICSLCRHQGVGGALSQVL